MPVFSLAAKLLRYVWLIFFPEWLSRGRTSAAFTMCEAHTIADYVQETKNIVLDTGCPLLLVSWSLVLTASPRGECVAP